MTTKKEITFEKGVLRLEQILEKMNSGSIALDESMKLFEEADELILFCNKQLTDAEKKIEILIKNRNGELELKKDQTPETKDFTLDE